MNDFLKNWLFWCLGEVTLTAILFFSYKIMTKLKTSSSERYLFLRLSFCTVLFLPLLPAVFLNEKYTLVKFENTAVIADLSSAITNSQITYSGISHNLFIALFGIYFIGLAWRTLKLLRSLKTLDRVVSRSQYLRFNSEVDLYLHDENFPPSNVGLWRPKILISQDLFNHLSESEIDMIIRHENAHIARRDYLFNLICIIVRDFLWYCPFVGKLAESHIQEMELSIDSILIEQDKFSAREYGNLLFKLAIQDNKKKLVDSVYAIYFSKSFLTRRISAMKVRFGKFRISTTIACFTIVAAFGGAAVKSLGNTIQGSNRSITSISSSTIQFFSVERSSDSNVVKIDGKPLFDANDFVSADPVQKSCGQKCTIKAKLNPSAAKRFEEFTASRVGQKIAIVINGKIVSSPIIKEAIRGDSLQITGDFTENTANTVVNSINSNHSK